MEEMPWERRSILQFVRDAAAALPAGAVIVDIGAGDAPYRELFDHCEYIATDWSSRCTSTPARSTSSLPPRRCRCPRDPPMRSS